MLCTGCGTANPVGNRFCGSCGESLALTCASCGAAATPDQRFCGQCGAPLAAEAAVAAMAAVPVQTPVAERRLCSVLFADLVGFTPLSESRDPEEVRELLSRYFEVTRTVIDRYGGTVEKFIGDAVMAVWGTPVAAEGDAERAVRAALEVVDAVDALGAELGIVELAARAGVVTGEVAVTIGASQEGMVAGDAVNTAARVQAAATPRAVLVDAATRRLAAGGVGFDDAGEHTLKGKTSPEPLWRATRVLAGVGGSQRIDGLEAPLTGRDAELRMLKELFHLSIDRRTPRLVVVAGAAGVGKSRLGWEFEKYADGLAQQMWWHRGRCLSYGEGVAFWALAQAVRQRLGIAEEDAVEVAAAKLDEGVTTIVADPSERQFVAVRLGRLLGLPVAGASDAHLGREELFAGWRVFFERLAAAGPVVLLIEDAQHADDGLLDFLDHLVDWSRDLPIFVAVLGRGELIEHRPGFGVGRNRSLLTMDALDPQSMDDLVEALVPGMPESARAAITGHAQGVPLFAVETIRSLVDRDIVQPIDGVYRLVGEVGRLTVPDSLHGLLAARLDALPTDVHALVADAAVLGTSFPADALVAISQQDEPAVRRGLDELVKREVLEVSADRLSPERGAYQFAQQLVRQVAYDTLSRRDRKARHLNVAAHLRASFPDDGEEVADVLARHYRDALDAVPDDADAGNIRELAIAMSVRAGRRATRAGSPAAATDSFAVAGNLAEASGSDEAAQWWEQAAQTARHAADYEASIRHARRAESLYAAAGRSRDAARCQASVGSGMALSGRMSEARTLLLAAIDVLRDEPNVDTVQAMSRLANVSAMVGDQDATQLVLDALDLAEAIEVDDAQMADTFATAGLAFTVAGRRAHATALYEHAVRLAERAGERYAQGRSLINLADSMSGFDVKGAVEACRAGIDVGRSIGARYIVAMGVANLADACLTMGDWPAAREALRRGVEDEALGDLPILACYVGLTAALCGDTETAHRSLDQLAVLRSSEDPQDVASVLGIEAVLAEVENHPESALGIAADALRHVDELGISGDSIRWSWLVAARTGIEVGDEAALRRLLDIIDARPIGQIPLQLRGVADVVRAGFRSDDDDDAKRLRDKGIEALRAIPAPYDVAWALLQRGHDADLDEAAEIADRLGAAPLTAKITVRRASASIPATA